MSVMMKLPEKYEENSKVFCQEVTVIACSISSYLSVSSVKWPSIIPPTHAKYPSDYPTMGYCMKISK